MYIYNDVEEMVEAMTKNPAEGAIPIGTTVLKAKGEEGDITPTGTKGVVKGSLKFPEESRLTVDPDCEFCYLVEFENSPDRLTFVIDRKIEKV